MRGTTGDDDKRAVARSTALAVADVRAIGQRMNRKHSSGCIQRSAIEPEPGADARAHGERGA